jgi:hypothetical protein
MSEEEYSAGMKANSFNTSSRHSRWHASAEPSWQYRASDQGVLVEIDYSDAQDWNAKIGGSGEVEAVTRAPVPASKVKRIEWPNRDRTARATPVPREELDALIELGINEEFPFIGENLEKWGYFGDRAALNKALADPQYEEYRDAAQLLARSYLGDEFKVYRIEGLYGTGEVEDIVSSTFNKRAKETGERLGREVLEATITPLV